MDLALILVREYLAMRHRTVKVANAWITAKELHVYQANATHIQVSVKEIIWSLVLFLVIQVVVSLMSYVTMVVQMVMYAQIKDCQKGNANRQESHAAVHRSAAVELVAYRMNQEMESVVQVDYGLVLLVNLVKTKN